MKTLSFSYTKADGKTSNRVVVVSNEPNKFYSGTDITELDVEEQGAYIAAIATAKELYLDMIKNINNTFDLNHNYRQFKPEGMADIKIEEI
jgi:hypothetical protein